MNRELLLVKPLTCTDVLPVELWEVILEKIHSMEDIRTCYATCRDWRSIVLTKMKPTLLLHKVIPVLWQYHHLESGDILNCRQVCQQWKLIVDNIPTHFKPVWGWRLRQIHVIRQDDHDTSDTTTSTFPSCKRLLPFQADSARLRALNCGEFNPARVKRLEYKVYLRNLFLSGEKYADKLIYSNGSKEWQLKYDCEDEDDGKCGRAVSYLASLFHEFPNLTSLDLSFGLELGPAGPSFLSQLESRVLAKLEKKELNGNGNEKVRLEHLVHLRLCETQLRQSGFNRDGMAAVLANVISTLIANSPSLRTFTWRVMMMTGGGPGDRDHHQQKLRFGAVFSALARSRVRHVVLEHWNEDLSLTDLVPVEHWGLRQLSMALRRFGGSQEDSFLACSSSVQNVTKCFLSILNKFSGSLEELRIYSRMEPCRNNDDDYFFGERRRRKGGFGLALKRICKCNKYYSKYKCYKEIPEFREMLCKEDEYCYYEGEGDQKRFGKLRILSISHALLHPILFPGVMAAVPNLKELRINDLIVADKKSSEKLVRSFVDQLWEEAPKSLRLIVVENWRWRSGHASSSPGKLGDPDDHHHLFWRNTRPIDNRQKMASALQSNNEMANEVEVFGGDRGMASCFGKLFAKTIKSSHK